MGNGEEKGLHALPKRKVVRLENYDYALSGTYFITVNTADRVHYLGEIVDGQLRPSPQGMIVDEILSNISEIFPKVDDLFYVIMPNHIHLLFNFINDEGDRAYQASVDDLRSMREIRRVETRPSTISSLMRNLKSLFTRNCRSQGHEIKWHRGFYEHIVRNNKDKQNIITYIQDNPKNWGIPKSQSPLGNIFYKNNY